ncbi:MAG: ABC transporter ATP-binding protein [Anaerolineae bacterium]
MAATNGRVIETRGLTRTFGATTAVRDLNLDVERGEVFVLLGPNGSGKTTTVRMLAALIAPTAGQATVVGQPLDGDDEALEGLRGRIGFLTESPGLYDRLSAEYNLMFFARLYRVAQPEKAVEKYLKLLGLWEQRSQLTGGFSKGMRQKVAIARAFLHEPDLVFLDEPTSGLDPSASRTVREFIEELKAEGRTIFLTTHNLDEAERLADRVGVLKQTLIAVDTPSALRQRLFGSRTLVTVANPDPRWVTVAQATPHVRGAALRDSVLQVDVDSPAEANPGLVAALVAAGAQVQFVAEDRASLEQVYLELVDGGGEKSATEAQRPRGR